MKSKKRWSLWQIRVRKLRFFSCSPWADLKPYQFTRLTVVDEQRRPGQYILLGSTEFSKLTNIRESLTGHASRLKIFPLTLAESKHLPLNSSVDFLNSVPRVSRNDLMKYLKNGGMPGLFGIKNENEKLNALKDWIDFTAERDAVNFKNIKIESQLINRILSTVALLADSSASSISKHLRTDLRKINTHLNILTTLFVLNKIEDLWQT